MILMENYQFIKQIGHGSYGEIWLVKCSKTRRKHVLKRIDLHQALKREQRAAHLEAKLLSTIKHPNIVTYLDSFHNSAGCLFIVMSYCECGDLYTYIRSQSGIHFEEKLIINWFVQICLALKYLHDKNILHRNLKTRNIFLTKNQIIKVGDLGISKVLSTTHEMTATLIETPYYISPEICAGAAFSQKSDIWALGCCIYEMATLRHPYVARDIHTLLQKVMKGKLPSIPSMYSSELFDIISSMLNQIPEERPCVTELLLDDYIRRYILLILQDNSKSPDSQVSENASELSERSKSSSELFPFLPIQNSYDIRAQERSISTSLVSTNTTKKPKISGAKAKTNQLKTGVISVPDVNGNGDGNDNSQHRKLRNIDKISHVSRTDYLKVTDMIESTNKYSSKSDDSKKCARPKMSSVYNRSDPPSATSKNSETSICANLQKRKGEISFQILNNLAYSLYASRQENFNGNLNSGSTSFETKHWTSKSPEYASSEKQSVVHPKKNAGNCNKNSKAVSQAKQHSSVCALPQIK